MAPVALSHTYGNRASSSYESHDMDHRPGVNGTSRNSFLQRHKDDEVHDLICVGFGPASLAIAVALQDAIEAGDPKLSCKNTSVRFLERQSQFAWHAGMLLPGTKMQITFVKDLATLRNPRSEFTFLNYLHQKDRLVSFTNLGTFLPQRIEYEDYMRWCAAHFDDVVDYDREVQTVDVGRKDPETGQIHHFEVRSTDRRSGTPVSHRAKNVVIAVGGKPDIPKCLRLDHPRIIHSSHYATSISGMFPNSCHPKSVAVVGAGQSAAEVFHNIPSRFPDAKCHLIIRGSALRPSDDSPFVNEIFDPERVDDVFSREPDARASSIAEDKSTNYGVVRLELLEDIYSTLYTYRIKYHSEEEWPQRILNHRTVTGVSTLASNGSNALRLHMVDQSGSFEANKDIQTETLDVDLIVVASGYRRDAHDDMLKGLEYLRPQGATSYQQWEVERDYSVRLKDKAVAPGAGIWLQGCNESTHGLSDTLLSILATRGGEMVENIFKPAPSTSSNGNGYSNGI